MEGGKKSNKWFSLIKPSIHQAWSHNSNNVLIPRIFRNSSCYDLTEKDSNPEIDIFFLSCVDFSIHAPLSSKVCGFFNPHTLEKKNSCLMEKDWKIYSTILLSKIQLNIISWLFWLFYVFTCFVTLILLLKIAVNQGSPTLWPVGSIGVLNILKWPFFNLIIS